MPGAFWSGAFWSGAFDTSSGTGAARAPDVGGPLRIGVGGPRLIPPSQGAVAIAAIAGTVVNTAGVAQAGATVKLFSSSTDQKLQQTTSAGDGTFAFYLPSSQRCYVVAYLAGSPDAMGTTRNDLLAQAVGVSKPSSQFNVILKPGQAVPTTLMLATPNSISTQPAAAAGVTTTLAALQAGSAAIKYVVAIEGYPYLLSDASPSSVLTAWAGTDWQQVLGGLFVTLDNEQKMHPWQPFQPGGRCTFTVVPDAADQFGIDTHRMASGLEALLTAPLDRGGSQRDGGRKIAYPPPGNTPSYLLPYACIDQNPGFQPGDLWIGTECVEIAGSDATHVYIRQRGKYSPFGCGGQTYYGSGQSYGQGSAKPGVGGINFAEYHRIAADAQAVLLQPTVSSQPRVWMGRRVGVWMHLVDANGNLNSKANAQLVYAGRIAQIQDDVNTLGTVVELSHLLDEIKDSTIGHDMYTATITEGIFLVQNWTFAFYTWTPAGVSSTANVLNVIAAGGTQDANDVPSGYYTCDQLCEILNLWLTSEFVAGRIGGPVQWAINLSGAAMRTQGTWVTSATLSAWKLVMPNEVAMFLGLADNTGQSGVAQTYGATATIKDGEIGLASGVQLVKESGKNGWPPMKTMIFRFNSGIGGVGGTGASGTYQMSVEDARGTAIDQSQWLPGVAQTEPLFNPGKKFGIFLIDESFLVVAGFDIQSTVTTFSPVYWLPGKMPGIANAEPSSFGFYGRHWDDQNQGPVTVRQVFILEGQFSTILKSLFYSSGTLGYNHPTYDTLGFGIGLGIPQALLGTTFEQSIDRLPGAMFPCALVIDKATRIGDLLSADLILRHAFPIFRNGKLAFQTWQTPTNDLATVTLAESNKAEPVGHQANHRTSTLLTSQWQQNVIKIQFNRDVTQGKSVGQNDTYLNEMTLEDHVSVDDQGQDAKPLTISCRNTYAQFNGTGAGVESLFPGFLALFPLFSKPVHWLTRSIDITNYEGVAPGDVALVTDAFARDPATGVRGIASRAGLITRIRYNPGGPKAGDPKTVTKPVGEVDVFFLDLHRWTQYSPSAEVDSTANVGGFSAGYNAAQWMLQVQAHAYSENSAFLTEATDASRFHAGDYVVVIEIDPVTLTSPLVWRTRLTAVNGNVLSLSQPLAGWDPTRAYRVLPDSYGNDQPSQQGSAFEASATTGKIAGVALPYQLSNVTEPQVVTQNSPLNKIPAELVPSFAYGDGKPHDVGHERSLVKLLNALHDGKTLHQQPWMWEEIEVSLTSSPRIITVIRPIFLGMDQLSTTVQRYLTVSPIVGATGAFQWWLTLTPTMPSTAPGSVGSSIAISFRKPFVQVTQSYSGPSSVQPVPYSLPIGNCKDVNGWAYLVMECSGSGGVSGFAQCIESARSV